MRKRRNMTDIDSPAVQNIGKSALGGLNRVKERDVNTLLTTIENIKSVINVSITHQEIQNIADLGHENDHSA